MTTRQKGRISELKTKKFLEEVGFDIFLVDSAKKFNHGVDIFGLWDLIARDPKTGKLTFIQVKTNRLPGKAYRKKLEACKLKDCAKQLWIWKDRVKHPVILDL
jgi:Holliday junction resolvase-like predicted endonuclease